MNMHRFWLCFATFCLLGGLVRAEEVIKVSPAKEAALKARVGKFWDGFALGKFRQSDAYVSEESKDDFFSWPKKKIKGYKIDKVFYADAGKAAKVVTYVDVNMALMGVGSMEVKQPIETWWRLEKGLWFWFQPKNQTRQTPFGQMESNPAAGEAPLVPTGQATQIPNLDALRTMVKPDRTELHFTLGEPKVETIHFANGMPGTVSLALDTPPSDVFSFQLSPRMVPRDTSASLIVTYKPTTKPADDAEPVVKVVRVSIAQTGKLYEIKLFLDPKK